MHIRGFLPSLTTATVVTVRCPDIEHREEAALDEAVMPADAFVQKQAMMRRLQEQQEAFKARMAGLPPEQRQYFMQQQQLVIAQMQQQVPLGCVSLCHPLNPAVEGHDSAAIAKCNDQESMT